MKKTNAAGGRLQKNRASLIVLLAAAVLFVLVRMWAAPPKAESGDLTGDYVEYENGVVTQVLSDSAEYDATSEGMRGEQLLLVEVRTGQYAGKTLQAYNYVNPMYGGPLKAGDGATLTISTYANGDVAATVYDFNRLAPVLIVIGLFLLVTVLVGGKTGAKSLVGLLFTVLCVLTLLFPALMKGAPTLPATFALCVYVAAVSFVILGGVEKKTLCALGGTVAGMALALLFALLSQKLLRINGLRSADVEPLLQLRQTGTPIGLRGLLAAGVVISALGAVMDVAMSLSSALSEVHAADPALGKRELFRSGMNIGRDMVGTMTNTLILAFIGSGLVLILYLYSIAPARHQLLSSAYLANELVCGVSSSIGVILSVPITAAISAAAYGRRTEAEQ